MTPSGPTYPLDSVHPAIYQAYEGFTSTYISPDANLNPLLPSVTQNPELTLRQACTTTTGEIIGGRDSCGAPIPFQITNLSFPGRVNAPGFVDDIYCGSTTTDYFGNIVGAHPRGQFVVQFVTSNCHLKETGIPTINRGLVTWNSSCTISSGGNFSTASPGYVFDMADLTEPVSMVGGAGADSINSNRDADFSGISSSGRTLTFYCRPVCGDTGAMLHRSSRW